MHSAKHQHHSKNLTKFHYFFVVFILLIAPLIVLFLTQKNKQTTTPDQSEAASTLPQSRAMKVMEISYLMGSGDGAMVSSVSNSLKQSIVEASKSKGSGTAVISGVNTVHSVTRNGPRPAGSSWQAGLQTIIDQDNLCQKIIDEKVDQVWIWVDPNRDTVNGFNQEYAISSSWVSDSGNLVDLCNGKKTFVVLGLQYTAEADVALHSLGHALENLIPAVQNRDLYWTKWAGGSDGGTNFSNCGDVHYPPGIPVDYGYDETRTFTNRCQNWSPDGTGVTNQATCSIWNCNQMGYQKWRLQRMPQRSQDFSYNGKKIPTWLDFLVDFENTVTYYVQNNYFISPHFAQFVTPEAVEKVSSATQQGQASSMSFAHTATGNNRLVLLTASYRAINQSADDKISGATYAGTPLTYVRRNQKGEYTTEIWYATGSIANSGNVVVNFGGSVQDKVVSAISFSDIDQSAPFQNNCKRLGSFWIQSNCGRSVIDFYWGKYCSTT